MADPIKVEVPKALEDLIPNYLEGVRKSASEMAEHQLKGDYETTRAMGHKLKGSGGGYGFDKISELGKSIEDSSKAGDGESVKNAIAMLQDFLQRVEVVYVDSPDW